MRTPLLILLVAAAAFAGELGRTLRALKTDDRERRREALETLATGAVAPESRRDRDRTLRALARFMHDRFPGKERALAVRALGRLDRPRAYEELLDRLEEETDDRVLREAEAVFRRAPPDVAKAVLRRFDRAKEPLARAVFLRMLGAVPGVEARERVRVRATMADHWCPRAAALQALARDRGDESLATLVRSLDDDDPAIVTAAIETLGRRTGKRFGREIAQWKAWFETRDEVAAIDEALEKAGKGDERTYAHETERRTVAPPFFGIPVKERRIAFVFDVSGSMRYKLPLAYDQLSRVVKGLPSTTLFEVIFFNEFVWPWRGRLSHADPVTKELLVRHIETIEIKSYTNLFDSLEKALGLGVDEVFVISDGEPNRGRRQHPRHILGELKRINKRGTKIHTISVIRTVDGGEHVALLKTIAEQHGGTHVQRTLR